MRGFLCRLVEAKKKLLSHNMFLRVSKLKKTIASSDVNKKKYSQ